MALTTLSSGIITQRKAATLEAQNLRKTVAFRDITLLDTDSIEYQGTRISITGSAFKNILKLLGMSQSFAKKFEDLFTKEAKSQFINTMKNAMASNSGNLSNVVLILNPISKSIVAITKEDKFGISNQQFMGVAENIIDNHSMEVSDWSIDPTNGIVSINAMNPGANFNVNGLDNEVFTGGVTFQNSPTTGFQVMPYVNRQWCSNGLTTAMSKEAYTLNSLDNASMEKFFENMSELRKNNFAPTGFADRVRAAHNTPASMLEMSRAHSLIKPFTHEHTESLIPLNENLSEYSKAGFETMSSAQMQNAKSNTSVWDLTNSITWVASNGDGVVTHNMQDHDATNLMLKAGGLFGKQTFDFETSMPDVFANKELIRTGSLLN